MYDIVDSHRERLMTAEEELRAELRAAEQDFTERRNAAFAEYNARLVSSETEMELQLARRLEEFRGLARKVEEGQAQAEQVTAPVQLVQVKESADAVAAE